MAGGVAVFSKEFVLILLFLTFIATSIFGTVMIMNGVIQKECPHLDGTTHNPHYFSIGTASFLMYYIKQLAVTFVKGRYKNLITNPYIGIAIEIFAGLFWFCWGIRGIPLYVNDLSAECKATDTGDAVLAYSILLIIIGVTWVYQGILAAKEAREIKTDIEQELMYNAPNMQL